MLVTSSGLLGSERLAPIREPPALDKEQVQTLLEEGKSAESYVLEDENYLPLSDLDLRSGCRPEGRFEAFLSAVSGSSGSLHAIVWS